MGSSYFTPIKVSEIGPVRNPDGGIKEWTLTVEYDAKYKAPHAKGARIVDDKPGCAEYHFTESVMGPGLRHALAFRDALLRQIERQHNENTK
jgi:hypothetical protein